MTDSIEDRNNLRIEAGLPPLDVAAEEAKLEDLKLLRDWLDFKEKNRKRAEAMFPDKPDSFMGSLGYGRMVDELLFKWYEES